MAHNFILQQLMLFLLCTFCLAKPDTPVCECKCEEYKETRDIIMLQHIAILAKTGDSHALKSAARTLKQMGNTATHIETLIPVIYDRKYENTQSAAAFLKNFQTTCRTLGKGILSLFQQMKSNNHLDQPEIMIVRSISKGYCGGEGHAEFAVSEAKPHVENIVARWADFIRTDNFSEINRFINSGNTAYLSSLKTLPEVIKSVLKNPNGPAEESPLETVLQLLKFTRSLRGIKASGISYLALIEELAKMGHAHDTLMLYASGETQRFFHIHKDDITKSTELDKIWDQIQTKTPPAIREVIWKPENCTIKNIHWNEYLFATDEPETFGNGQVFLGNPENETGRNTWSISRLGNYVFETRFQSTNFSDGDHNLCEYEHAQNSSFYKVVTCSLESNRIQPYWTLVPVEVSSNETKYAFQLKSSGSGGFLYGTNEKHLERESRAVGTGASGPESFWEIKC